MASDQGDGLRGLSRDRRDFLMKLAGGAAIFGTPTVVSFTLDDGGDKAEASGEDVGRALYDDPPTPAITVAKLVSTVPNQCGTSAALTVPAGTTVYYCYTVTNIGNVTLSKHTVVDDKLGTIVADLAVDLPPGSSASVFSPGVTVTATVTNVATWTASGETEDAPGAEVDAAVTLTAQTTGSATVTVAADEPQPLAPKFTG